MPSERRHFAILPTDCRFAHAAHQNRKVRFQLPAEKFGAQRTIQKTLRSALAASYTASTKAVHGTHMSYWRDFCAVAQLSDVHCFSPDVSLTDTVALNAEASILGAFFAFVVVRPKRGKSQNSAAYALQILSTVRSFFQDRIGRKPGIAIDGLASGNLRAVIIGLKRIAPSVPPKRRPVLQFHLRAVRMHLNLATNQLHGVAWALWLTQWQGCLRAGDLLRGKREVARV